MSVVREDDVVEGRSETARPVDEDSTRMTSTVEAEKTRVEEDLDGGRLMV